MSRVALFGPNLPPAALFSSSTDIKALGHRDMSAQVYNRFPPAPPQAPSSRRHPLANAQVNQATGQPAPSKPQEAVKAPPSPPLPRQNTKTAPPSPPKIITDKSRSLNYHRVGFLGEVSDSHVGTSIDDIANGHAGRIRPCL